MDRIVGVLRNRQNDVLLLNPMGCFKGCGAYVGINPYREVLADHPDGELGAAVVELLGKSIPTGRHVREIADYRAETTDQETNRIRSKYFSPKQKTTSAVSRRFIKGEVVQKPRQKSWLLHRYKYDSKQRLLKLDAEVRVKHADGLQALGKALKQLLSDPR